MFQMMLEPQQYNTNDNIPTISVSKIEIIRKEVLRQVQDEPKCCNDIKIKNVVMNSIRGRLSELATEGYLKEVYKKDGFRFYVKAEEWEREGLARGKFEKRLVRALNIVLEDIDLPVHVRQCLVSRVKELRGE